MGRTITLVPGDKPELADNLKALVHTAGIDITWEEPGGDLVTSIRRNGAALVGFQHGDRDRGQLPPAVTLRRDLAIYAQERPIRALTGVASRFTDVDILVIRETTEDVYTSLEHESIPGVFESLKVTTRAACERIARYAFEVARARGRKKVTIVHKSNIMKLSDGMFLRVGREVSRDYPDITCDEFIVDALCMRIVLDPTRFDVLLCGNLFGDIVSDMCAGLVGGAAMAPALNVGDGVVVATAGQQSATPLALAIPMLYLLRHLGDEEDVSRLWTTVSAEM